jgi:hypothetical protein
MGRLAVLLAMTVAAGAQPAASFAVGGVLRTSDGSPLVSATINLVPPPATVTVHDLTMSRARN